MERHPSREVVLLLDQLGDECWREKMVVNINPLRFICVHRIGGYHAKFIIPGMSESSKLARPGMLPSIAYRTEGSGAPVVLVHGVGGDSSNWDGVASRLVAKFRIVKVDLRGHGRSAPIRAPCTVEDLACDVTDVLDALGVHACRLVGFSLGGQVAQSIALQAPDRVEKLVLISAVAGRTESERAGAASRVKLLRDKGTAAIAESNRERWFTDEFRRRHPDKVEARVQQVLRSDPESYLHAFTVFATADLGARLDAIRAPTLIITGESDVAATPRMAQLMHDRITNSELRVLPALRHSLLVERPDLIADLLLDFL
jgi:3-oxoadipate enol-lactonase